MDPALEARVRAAGAALRGGGLVAYPTETFYGLGAVAADAGAVSRLARAKGRADGKPLPVVAADLAAVEAVAVVSPAARHLAGRFWPGPLTLVLPARPGLAPEITAGTGTVGVRVPGSEVARALAREAGGTLVSTSANPAGAAPPASPAELDPVLRATLADVVDGGAAPGGLPSTIVALEGDAPRLVRAGAVPFEAVERALRQRVR